MNVSCGKKSRTPNNKVFPDRQTENNKGFSNNQTYNDKGIYSQGTNVRYRNSSSTKITILRESFHSTIEKINRFLDWFVFNKSKKIFALSILLLMISIFLFSPFRKPANALSGLIDEQVNLYSGTYYLTDDVTVVDGGCLYIHDGVTLKVQGNYSITATGNGCVIRQLSGGSDAVIEHDSSTSRGSWNGFVAENEGALILHNTVIRHARRAIRVKDNTSLAEVSNSTFETNNIGIQVYQQGDLTANSNYFNDNEFPLNLDPDVGDISMSGNTLGNNDFDAIVIGYNDLSASNCPGGSCRIKKRNFAGITNIPYVVHREYTVSGSTNTLTIDPGVVVKGRSSWRPFEIDSADLYINGNPGDRTIITCIQDDSHGGDTNNDGTSTTPSVGKFTGIEIYGGGTATIEYADFYYSDKGMRGRGTGTSVNITESTFNQNAVGVEVYGGASLTTSSNTFTNNRDLPLVINPDAGSISLGTGASSDTLGSGHDYNAIGFGYADETADCPGGACELPSRTFAGISNIPYLLWSAYNVENSGDTLTIDPGVIVKGRISYRSLDIKNGAHLVSNGSSGSEVIITSHRDDTYGGDTNNDGSATSPAPGNFEGIEVSNGSSADIDYTNFYYTKQAIRSYNTTDLNVNESLFDNNRVGIEVYAGADLTTSSNTFTNNENLPLVINPDCGSINLGTGASSDTLGSGHDYDAIGFGYSEEYSSCPSNVCSIPSRTFAGISNIPYLLWGAYTVDDSADVLTIDPGVIVKGRLYHKSLDFRNGAQLVSNGTDGNEVVITSGKDDTYGGDTNNDGSATSPAPGNFEGIEVYNGSSADIDFTEFYHTKQAVRSYNGAALDVNESLFDNNRVGIEVYDGVDLTTSSNTFTNNEHLPLVINPDCGSINLGTGVLADTLGSGNGYDAIGFGYNQQESNCPSNACSIPSRTFAGISNIPYVLYEGYTVGDALDVLTIDPGIIIKGRLDFKDLRVTNGADLVMNGVDGNEIIVTSHRDDTYGGDTNNDGSATSPAPGDFGGIRVDNGSSGDIDYTNFHYCQSSVRAHMTDTVLNVSNNLFDDNKVGVEVWDNADLTTQSNTFTNNDLTPVVLNPDVGTINFGSGVDVDSISDNGYAAIGFSFNQDIAVCPSNNCTFSQREFAGISNIPYVCLGDYAVQESADVLTFDPGVVLKYQDGHQDLSMENGASIDINGQYKNEVVFTADEDDNFGGDTNNDGTLTSPSPGNSSSIRLQGSGAHRIDYLNVYYADIGLDILDATDVVVNDSDFLQGGYGIEVNTTVDPTFNRINIEDNVNWGMYNDSTSLVVTAEHLWWGSADGPYDDSNLGQCSENLGAGDNVSDDDTNQIDYCPYAMDRFNSETCAQNNDCPSGYYCATGGTCEAQLVAGSNCDDSETEFDSTTESDGVCSSGYCRDDYDDDGDGDGNCEAGEGCWCVASADECATDSQSVSNGSYAPNDCFVDGGSDNDGERAVCNAGVWGGESCGYGSTYECNNSCSRSRDVFYCGDGDNTCYNGGSNDVEPCPAQTACSAGNCVTDGLCDSDYEYGGGSGDDQYNSGGLYHCQATCDGGGSCDFATTCELHAVAENVSGGLDVRNGSGEDITSSPQTGVKTVYVRDNSTNYLVAEIEVDFSTSVDWTDLSAAGEGSNSFFHYPGGYASLPGAVGSTYILYVPIPSGTLSSQVLVCPGASDINDVYEGCSGGEYKNESDSGVTKVEDAGQYYWKIEGVSGTGGMALIESFDIKDTLTRLEVSATSDHRLRFGTIDGANDVGETIQIEFDPVGQSWDLSDITVDDIDLQDDGADLNLAATADSTHWGVNIEEVDEGDSADRITFTHPTDGSNGDIGGNSVIVVEIGTNATSQVTGTNQIINPSSVSEYEVHLKIQNDSGTETGEVEIPIVDDDTVNVHGFMDTQMSFDIDTAVSDADCDASGGGTPCNSHGGASDGAGYVVDLGEMTLESVNKSGDSVMHADGLTGQINYIWFDLETNASGGAVVTVISENEGLYMDGSNAIPSVAGGGEMQITSGDGLYGLNHHSGLTNTYSLGSLIVDDDCDCDNGDDRYCDVADGGTPISLFTSNNLPVDDGRMQFAVGAAPDSADGTGTYTDQLTFVATATF